MPESSWSSEAEIVRALSMLREESSEVPEHLPDKTMDSVHAAIASGDLVELATSVLVREFVCPVLDVLAFALGLTNETDQDGSSDNV